MIPNEIGEPLISKLEQGSISLFDLHCICRELSQPQIPKPGKILIFDNKSLHGTLVNTSSSARLSLDFRIALSRQHLGNKKLHSDYVLYENIDSQTTTKSKANSIVYSSGLHRCVTHRCQRAFIEAFGFEKGFDVVGEANEILNSSDVPQIKKYLNESSLPIIVFSFQSFSGMQKLSLQSLNLDDKARIFFALEDMVLSEVSPES